MNSISTIGDTNLHEKLPYLMHKTKDAGAAVLVALLAIARLANPII